MKFLKDQPLSLSHTDFQQFVNATKSSFSNSEISLKKVVMMNFCKKKEDTTKGYGRNRASSRQDCKKKLKRKNRLKRN